MKIKEEAWHFGVFLQAYVRDHGWIDAFTEIFGDEPTCPELPEVLAKQKFLAALKKSNPDDFTHILYYSHPGDLSPEDRMKNQHYWNLVREERAAVDVWRRAEWQRQHEARAKELEARLYAKRVSLCPYFWRVVIAVVFYYPIVRPVRGMWRGVISIAPPLEWMAARLAVALLVGVLGYGLYAGREVIPQVPGKVVASVKSEYMSFQIERKFKAEREAEQKLAEERRLAERLEWERTHPEEVRERREAEAERALELAQYERENAQQRSKKFWADAKDMSSTLALGIVCVALVVVAFLGGIALLVKVLQWIGALVSVPLGSVTERLARSTFRKRLAQAWASWRQFWTDTRELVVAFAKAKKERVCPFITVVRSGDQH